MKTLFTLLALCACIPIHAQTRELQLIKGRYYVDGIKSSYPNVQGALSTNTDALKMYRSGHATRVTGNVITLIGAFGIGWEVTSRLTDRPKNNTLLAGGCIVTAAGMITELCGQARIRRSFKLYKEGASTSAGLNMELSRAGLTACLRF